METLVHFGKSEDLTPQYGLMLGRDGQIYGNGATGGSSGEGLVFRLSPTGEFTALANFEWASGGRPRARLLQARDGKFYGVTSFGGYYNNGTVFSMALDGKVQVLSHLTGRDKVSEPNAALVQGSDGNFYGTSSTNGGTVYKVTPAGAVTRLVEFNGRDGGTPVDELTQGVDGSLYGTTSEGGKFGLGTVFKVSTAGDLTVLVDFDGFNGVAPMCKLLQGRDGNFYGTTSTGGRADAGTVFRVTPGGVLKTLFEFHGANGKRPAAGLILGRDGNFYGTTSQGGRSGLGTVFRLTPKGILTTITHFGGPNGARPEALLVQSADGRLYGTTSHRGRNDAGTVFRISLAKSLEPLPAAVLAGPRTGGATNARRLTVQGTADGTVPLARIQVRTKSPAGKFSAWKETRLRGDGALERWSNGVELPTVGLWQVQARVMDDDDKRSRIVTRTILVDRKSPSMRVDTSIVSRVSASERRLIIRGRASDDSAPAAMQYRVRSESGKFGNWQRTSLSGKGSSRTLAHPVILPGPGNWTVEVRVVDGAGNPSRSMIRSVIVNRPHPGSIPTAPTTRPTVKYSQGDPTSLEQFMLEMLNRSRANPTVEARRLRMDLGSGLPAGAVTAARKQPLALNPLLVLAARDHSRWLAQGYELGHSGAGGSTPAQRAVARGFKFGVAENVSQVGSTGTIEPIWAINNSHDGLFESPGHRTNILDPTASVVGVGIVSGKRPDDPPFMIGVKGMLFTQKFSSGDTDQTGAFITGVAFDDKDGDGFYSLGEGLAGIEVRPAWGKYYAVTSKSGGFAIPLAALGRQPGVVTVSLPFPVAPRDAWEKARPHDEKFRAEQIRNAPLMGMELRWTSKTTGLSLKSKVIIKRPMLIEYRLMGTDGMFFPRSMITSSSVKADLVYTNGKPRVVMP